VSEQTEGTAFRVDWFTPPDRPVDGTTVFVRPEPVDREDDPGCVPS
jgi:hypothetical protein